MTVRHADELPDVTEHPPPVIGQRLLRKEDPALLTGEAQYTNDLDIPGALHLAVVRSPHAHARIVSIDTSAAAAMPGVVAVYTGADLRDAWAAPMPCAWPVTDDMKNPVHYPLAIDTVCYAGDGVAVVLAVSDAVAHDAIDAIDVRVRGARRRSSTSRTPCPTGWSSTRTSAPTARTRGRSRSRAPRARSTRPCRTPRTPSASATSSNG